MSILKNLYPVDLLITLAVLISPVNVQAEKGKHRTAFSEVDLDGDGKILENEF